MQATTCFTIYCTVCQEVIATHPDKDAAETAARYHRKSTGHVCLVGYWVFD